MRNLKFILSALAILLAGALAAGFAARAVVAPRAGEILSAGVLPIPSVLGQTADEVLFYPWSLYDMQDLTPISDAEVGEFAVGGNSTSIAAMDALGADFDMEALIGSQVTNRQEGAVNKAETVYVKDHPAVLPDGNTPVLLNYARSGSPRSVSWLMIPQEGAELSEERRQAALDKVKGDLAQFIQYKLRDPQRNFDDDLTRFLTRFDTRFREIELDDESYLLFWRDLMFQQYGCIAYDDIDGIGADETSGIFAEGAGQEEAPLPLEELLAQGLGDWMDIQFISTPRQVVLLFNMEGGMVIGVYYDVQLERYSGLGLSG